MYIFISQMFCFRLKLVIIFFSFFFVVTHCLYLSHHLQYHTTQNLMYPPINHRGFLLSSPEIRNLYTFHRRQKFAIFAPSIFVNHHITTKPSQATIVHHHQICESQHHLESYHHPSTTNHVRTTPQAPIVRPPQQLPASPSLSPWVPLRATITTSRAAYNKITTSLYQPLWTTTPTKNRNQSSFMSSTTITCSNLQIRKP